METVLQKNRKKTRFPQKKEKNSPAVFLPGSFPTGICVKHLAACLLFLVVSGSGCATRDIRPPAAPPSPFFSAIDAAIKEQKVTNAAAFAVPGFPSLRCDRFLVAMAKQATGGPEEAAWIRHMTDLQIQTRQSEIKNLAPETKTRLAASFGCSKGAALSCLKNLLRAESDQARKRICKDPEAIQRLRNTITAPEEYRTWMRIFGYPAAYLPVRHFTVKGQKKFSDWHKTPTRDLPAKGPWIWYQVSPGSRAPFSMIPEVRRDALDIPLFSPAMKKALFRLYAPELLVETASLSDRPATIVNGPTYDTDRPCMYTYSDFGLFKDRPVLRLYYTVWFTKRTGPHAPRIERGPGDGITFRVTIDEKGHPIAADIMNTCGCYHFFLPDTFRMTGIRKPSSGLPAFVPSSLPNTYPQTRMVLRINAGWHQVTGILTPATTKTVAAKSEICRIASYTELESLPQNGGSFFTESGIAKGSSRIEPLLFFPMGIPKVGYMRQRNHHPVKLIGREYFSDPKILEKNFYWKE